VCHLSRDPKRTESDLKNHKFTICGNTIDWKYVRLRGDADGLAYIRQDGQKQKVLIHSALVGRERLETEVHEFCHVANPTLSESHVRDQSASLARILWALGYRLGENK